MPIFGACGQALTRSRRKKSRFRYFPTWDLPQITDCEMDDFDLPMYDLTYLSDVVCFRVLRWGTFTHFTVLLRIFDLKSTHSRVVGYTKNRKFYLRVHLLFTSNDYKSFSQWPVGTIASCLRSIGVEVTLLTMLPHQSAACRANRQQLLLFLEHFGRSNEIRNFRRRKRENCSGRYLGR